jgi:large subunit ribosomal protein L21
MYAVIETGGKQYRVEVGTELEVELLEVEAGQSITLDRVLLVADGDRAAVGRPVVENASVAADVVRQMRGEKTISFKYRPKARSRVMKGHRQELTLLRISDIVLDGKSAAAEVREARELARTERERVEEAAMRQAAADAELAAKLAASAPAKDAPATKASGTKASATKVSKPTGAAAKPAAAKPAAAATKPAADPKPAAGTRRAAAPKAPAKSEAAAATPKKTRSTKKDG